MLSPFGRYPTVVVTDGGFDSARLGPLGENTAKEFMRRGEHGVQ
jgi:hypothetical protein